MEYVTRESACTVVMGQNMPVPRPGRVRRTRAWIDRQEQADRKNARVIDKIMLALPRELDAPQRADLVHRFAEELTGGRTPWLAAFHDKGKDQHNPHCHFVLRDRHVDTGKRVVGMSEKGSTERVRQLWERLANDALAAAGSTTRIDRRSLAAQRADKLDQAARCGARDPDRAATLRAEAHALDRAPQGHLGPKARAVKAEGRHSTKIARIEEAQEARTRAERAQEAQEAREAAQGAREAERALRAAQIAAEGRERARREEEGAAERRRAALEARKAWEAAQGAKRADRALTAAQDALRASQGELGRAARNRDAAAEILTGRRELMTGRPKPTRRALRPAPARRPAPHRGGDRRGRAPRVLLRRRRPRVHPLPAPHPAGLRRRRRLPQRARRLGGRRARPHRTGCPREARRLDRAPARAAPPARRHRAGPGHPRPSPGGRPLDLRLDARARHHRARHPGRGSRDHAGHAGGLARRHRRSPANPRRRPHRRSRSGPRPRPQGRPDLGRGRTPLAGGRAQATASASARSPQALRPRAGRSLGALTPFSAIRPLHQHAVGAVWRGMRRWRRWQEIGPITSHPGPPRRALRGRVIHKGVRGIHLDESRSAGSRRDGRGLGLR